MINKPNAGLAGAEIEIFYFTVGGAGFAQHDYIFICGAAGFTGETWYVVLPMQLQQVRP